MKISTASLPLTLLTLGLAAGGCIPNTGSPDWAPSSGLSPYDTVAEAMDGLYFEDSATDAGLLPKVFTFNPDSGQICMAIFGLAEPDPLDPSASPTPEDTEGWSIFSAQVSYSHTEDGTPYFYGDLYWHGGGDDWRPYGSYKYYPSQNPSELGLRLPVWPETELQEAKVDEATLPALEACSKLLAPDVYPSPGPSPTPDPNPTPWPQDPTPI